MSKFLWKCGHVSTGKQCQVCGCETIEFLIHNIRDHLDGRYAICNGQKVKSRWDLPGFVYRPDQEYDLFFYGNPNKVYSSGKVYSITTIGDKVINNKGEEDE